MNNRERVLEKENGITLIQKELTDGSFVYNVMVSDNVDIAIVDSKTAHTVFALLSNSTSILDINVKFKSNNDDINPLEF